MSRRIKVMTIVGTRPEIIKLSRIIPELDKYTDHLLVHSGQNYDYELNQVFFDDLEIRKPDYFLNAAVAGNPMQTIANVLVKSDELFEKEQPDALLLYGDTNTCLSVIAAKRRKIPVFHMEAGNRCFDQRVPEELNRKVVDHLSDINLPLTEHARGYLLREGLAPEKTIKSGSCMKEVLNYFSDKIEGSDVLSRLNLDSGEYFIVSAHREENVDDEENLNNFFNTLVNLRKEYGRRVIISTHPRTRNRLEKSGFDLEESGLEFMKPLGFLDYIKLQKNARCVISDSGTITEESSLLSFPAITIRNAHERPEGMDEGTLIMSGLKWERVHQAVETVTGQHSESEMRVVPDYDVENVSKKMVRIIISYVDYIKRTVWSES
jgi:UDP-N-acetylglucosamine 2-epimerase (non-hydrolysing)